MSASSLKFEEDGSISLQVVLLGETHSGTTSLCVRFVDDKFCSDEPPECPNKKRIVVDDYRFLLNLCGLFGCFVSLSRVFVI